MGGKLPRVGGKIPRGILSPGGQAAQGGKINCYTGSGRAVSDCFPITLCLSIGIDSKLRRYTRKVGQRMIKSGKLFFRFLNSVKIMCPENGLEDQNTQKKCCKNKMFYSMWMYWSEQ